MKALPHQGGEGKRVGGVYLPVKLVLLQEESGLHFFFCVVCFESASGVAGGKKNKKKLAVKARGEYSGGVSVARAQAVLIRLVQRRPRRANYSLLGAKAVPRLSAPECVWRTHYYSDCFRPLRLAARLCSKNGRAKRERTGRAGRLIFTRLASEGAKSARPELQLVRRRKLDLFFFFFTLN